MQFCASYELTYISIHIKDIENGFRYENIKIDNLCLDKLFICKNTTTTFARSVALTTKGWISRKNDHFRENENSLQIF